MKVVVFYFTQSGQALEAAEHICSPISESGTVIYKRIVPRQTYPFPWSKQEFLSIFPETRLGLLVSGIEPIDFSDVTDAVLVMVAGQSWYLSPSLPLQAFFADAQVRTYLRGRQIVFVNACRNMWVTTLRTVRESIAAMDAHLVGHIVLQDRHANIISAITVVRWLLHDKKAATVLLPAAGVSDDDLKDAARFGEAILQTHRTGGMEQLQLLFTLLGAVEYKPSVVFIEKTGHRMFGYWASFIRQKGDLGAPQRQSRIRLFYCYLTFALYVLSPIAQLLFLLTYPLHHVSDTRRKDCALTPA